ncbi:MAG: Crp/Fnr family transcriptional regulator [Bacteroidia bacterium]|nr:Crp/Fnr family transcriptional regulator [Bacteroidia bacterium]
MTIEDILESIKENYSPLSPACFKELIENIEIKQLEKGTTLVKEGQYADKSYFIVQGCARAYYLHEGRDISDWFAFEDEFISAIISFFTDQPSPHYIEVLQDSILIEISRETTDYLSDKYHDFERLIKVVVTKTMLSQRERISSILFHTAEEKYEQMLAIRPDIVQRVPLMHIASYLGMTLETLSRIRKLKN